MTPGVIAGSFHPPTSTPFRRVFLCLVGLMAKLAMRVCGDVCEGECIHGCFVFGCVDVDCVGGEGGGGHFEFL